MDPSRRAIRHSGDKDSGGGTGGVSSQSFSLSFCLLLAEVDGKRECEEGRT
jgi:hypothetical protein